MVWESIKPMVIRKGTVGYVLKYVNPKRPEGQRTRWRHKVYTSPQNIMNSMAHGAYYKGDTVYVYDAATKELVYFIYIRWWDYSDPEITMFDINRMGKREAAEEQRQRAGAYEDKVEG